MKQLTIETVFRRLIYFFILIFWPVSLFLANTKVDFVNYLVPTLLIVLSYFLYKKANKFYLAPTLVIPFVQPKLALLPVLFVILNSLFTKKLNKVLLFASLIVFVLFSNQFINQSVFKKDYNQEQVILQKTFLYPSIPLARTFQNKGRIYLDKLNNNFFSLIDPNNYFFGFQPRQIVLDNQNLEKYAFATIIFFLFGLYYLKKNPDSQIISIFPIGSILCLTLLTNFDRQDFILWLPLCLILISGEKDFKQKLKSAQTIVYFLVVFFSLAQFIRLFIQYITY